MQIIFYHFLIKTNPFQSLHCELFFTRFLIASKYYKIKNKKKHPLKKSQITIFDVVQ